MPALAVKTFDSCRIKRLSSVDNGFSCSLERNRSRPDASAEKHRAQLVNRHLAQKPNTLSARLTKVESMGREPVRLLLARRRMIEIKRQRLVPVATGFGFEVEKKICSNFIEFVFVGPRLSKRNIVPVVRCDERNNLFTDRTAYARAVITTNPRATLS